MRRRGFLAAFAALVAAPKALFAGQAPLAPAPLPPSPDVAARWSTGGRTLFVAADGSGAFLTLAAALKACQPGRGDVIILKAGHSETISAPLPGPSDISVIGESRARRPRLTWGRR